MIRLSVTFFAIVSMTLLSIESIAQVNTDSIKSVSKNEYVISYKERISIRANLNNDIESFRLITDELDLQLDPNTSISNSYKFGYQFILFSVSFTPSFLNQNTDQLLKGNSKIIRFGTDIGIGDHINQHLSFQKIRGFYLENTVDFNSNWMNGDPFIQFPELNYLSWKGATTYIFNPNFSLFAIDAINQRQIKTNGSFLADLSYRYYIIDNRIELNENNSSQKTNSLELIPSLGYAITLVQKENFYFSIGGKAGIGYLHRKLTTRFSDESFTNSEQSLVRSFTASTTIGYDNGRFFSGAMFDLSNTVHDQNGGAVFDTRGRFQVNLGYRFNAPKTLNKRFGSFMKRIKK